MLQWDPADRPTPEQLESRLKQKSKIRGHKFLNNDLITNEFEATLKLYF